MPSLGAMLTTFYMFRLVLVAFTGRVRSHAVDHAHESPRVMTVPLLLAQFKGADLTSPPNYGILAAGSVIATIPLILIFFFFQRWLVSGIMSGALKA